MSHSKRAESLHDPWPSKAEELQGRYGDRWCIWRELKADGTHGDWAAQRLDGSLTQAHQERGLVNQLTASSIEELRELLASQERLAAREGAATVADSAQTPREVLESLRQELTDRGLATLLSGEGPYPCLRVMDGHLVAEWIFAARYDEPNYTWSQTSRQHPLDDPAGAAERIVGDLVLRRVQQGLARSRG